MREFNLVDLQHVHRSTHIHTQCVFSLCKYCVSMMYKCTVKDSSSFVRDSPWLIAERFFFFFLFFSLERSALRQDKDAFIIPFSHLFVPRIMVALTSMLSSVCSLFSVKSSSSQSSHSHIDGITIQGVDDRNLLKVEDQRHSKRWRKTAELRRRGRCQLAPRARFGLALLIRFDICTSWKIFLLL